MSYNIPTYKSAVRIRKNLCISEQESGTTQWFGGFYVMAESNIFIVILEEVLVS